MAFSQMRRLLLLLLCRFTANLAVFPQAAEGFLIFYSCHLKRGKRGKRGGATPLLIYLTAYRGPRGVCVLFAFMPNSAHILRGPRLLWLSLSLSLSLSLDACCLMPF